jgi:type II secretory pathway pseudopilin PulG
MNFGYGIFVVSYALTSLLGSNVSSAITIPNATNFTMPKTFEEAALKCASGDTSIPSGVCSVVNLVSQQLEQRRQEQEAQKKALAEQQAQLAEQRRQMEEQAKQQQQNQPPPSPPSGGGGGQQGGGDKGGGDKGGGSKDTPGGKSNPVADTTKPPPSTPDPAAGAKPEEVVTPGEVEKKTCACKRIVAGRGIGCEKISPTSFMKGPSKLGGMDFYAGDPTMFKGIVPGKDIIKPKGEFVPSPYDGKHLTEECERVPGFPTLWDVTKPELCKSGSCKMPTKPWVPSK